ncbi:ADP-ribosylation factor GTPase-activating protein AGD5-like isoform X2 [Rosa rugosa]|uniref:ADP-ribosylation factor GTPase-activating protein AGD5-like isoform X2 n=1 Tax=Rosa rugosa TaxID=74645 RepID=UPI002B40A5C5|nr:ADP-ribosylation factor GTPase-activating protein AGD5-like isoform X2 [Rosa rugosa]
MNQKANVSKELNAKHRKILEGLLKLPENRECADCKTIAPRWASVNLGIFICMQCSGAHRSLGVHISKVRSATLDTWLPEQIAFIQSMGNEKSNSYWEAELPPNYDRVGIENFIRAKYESKKWVPRDDKLKSPPRVTTQKTSVYGARPEIRSKHGDVRNIEQSYEQKVAHPPGRINRIPQQVSDDLKPKNIEKKSPEASQKPQELEQKTEPVAPKPEPASHRASATPISAPVKVDYATDLFNMLSMEESRGSDSVTFANNITLPTMHSAETKLAEEKNNAPKSSESKVQSKYGIEDLFIDTPSITQTFSVKPQTDVKNDIINLFEKSSIVSPFSMHQQQQAMLSQQHSLLMAAAPNSSGSHSFSSSLQPASQAIHLPTQNGRSVGQQVPGNPTPPNLQYYSQIGNGYHARPIGNAVSYSTSSMYTMRPVAPINGVRSIGGSRVSTPPPKSSVTPTPSGRDFDFSSLTQGLFTKR